MQQPVKQPKPISIDEFLPILLASEVKLELIDGQIVAFSNGNHAHGLIRDRIEEAIRSAAQYGCEIFSADVPLRRTDAPTYVFPDVSYTCEPLEPDVESIVAPTLLVEVMSPLSVGRDRIDKLDSYQAIPSVQEYLIVDSRRIWASLYRRSNRTWIHTIYAAEDTIELVSLGNAQLKMADLYAGLRNLIT